MRVWLEAVVVPVGVLRAPVTGRALRLWMALARLHRERFEWPTLRRLLAYMPPTTDARTIHRARIELIRCELLCRNEGGTWSLCCPEEGVDLTGPTATADIFAEVEEPGTPDVKRMDGYMDFWAAYPKKVRPERARKAWAAVQGHKYQAEILAAIEEQKKPGGPLDMTRDGGQYVPYPSTWLNGHGWKDEVHIAPKKAPARGKRGDGALQGTMEWISENQQPGS